MLRDPNVSGGVMPGRRAQRICQGGTSGPSGIAMRNVSVRGKDGDTSDTLRTHTGRHKSALTCTQDPVYGHMCVDPQLSESFPQVKRRRARLISIRSSVLNDA